MPLSTHQCRCPFVANSMDGEEASREYQAEGI